MTERLAYSVAELQEALGIGRATARRLAKELGIRVSPRRIVVPAVRLKRWLEGGDGSTVTLHRPETEQAHRNEGRAYELVRGVNRLHTTGAP
jgi:Helix-turn-helix domain